MDYSCFNNQVIVISGGGGEIGGGSAVEFAKWGARVALIDIHEGRLQEIVARCKEAGLTSDMIHAVHGDCMKHDQLEGFVQGTVEKFGQIDVLLNVVGTKRIKGLETSTMEDLDWCLDGNIKTTFLLSKLCMPYLKKTQGNVINISSFSAARPMWEILPYSIAKAGIDLMTRCMAMEFVKDNVRVNCISPASLRSKFNVRFGDVFPSEEQLEGYFKHASAAMPLGYIGDPETHVVPLILFLASDKVKFVNGAVIIMDGGYSNTVNTP